jgi:hypothetical protein
MEIEMKKHPYRLSFGSFLLTTLLGFFIAQTFSAPAFATTQLKKARDPASDAILISVNGIDYNCESFARSLGVASAKKTGLQQAKEFKPYIACKGASLSGQEEALLQMSSAALQQCNRDSEVLLYQKYFMEGFSAGAQLMAAAFSNCQ